MSREIRSPVYQIDFTAVDAGKRIASTKRRIRWRFGFTNQDALAAGETGTACRGEEHDITLIWSLTSGKRLVLADGQEVHYSNSRSQIFDFSWTMRGNHVLKVVAHGTTPMNSHPTFRQYDFFVDGMSFFSMPKVYRLGLTDSAPIQEPGTLALAQSSRRGTYGNYTVGGSVGGGGGSVGARTRSTIMEIETPHNAQEEEAYLREAIKASLSEQADEPRNHSSTMSYISAPEAPKQDDLLIDFMSEPNPAPTPAPASVPDTFAMVPAPNPTASVYAQPPPPFGAPSAPVPPQPQTMPEPAPAPVPVQPVADIFAPAPVSAPPTAPAPSPFAPAPMAPPQIPTAPTPAPTPASSFVMQAPAPPPAMPPATPVPAPYAPAPVAPAPAPEAVPAPTLTMAPQSSGLGTDANAAYAKFANMDQFDLVKPKGGTGRANPFDDPIAPTNASVSSASQQTTLADMKAKAMSNGTEKKPVMNNNSMVVAQAQNGNFGGGYNNYSGVGVAPVPGATAAPGYGMGSSMGMSMGQPMGMGMGGQMQYQQGYPQQQPQYGMPQQQVPPQFQQSQQAYGAQPQQPF